MSPWFSVKTHDSASILVQLYEIYHDEIVHWSKAGLAVQKTSYSRPDKILDVKRYK